MPLQQTSNYFQTLREASQSLLFACVRVSHSITLHTRTVCLFSLPQIYQGKYI